MIRGIRLWEDIKLNQYVYKKQHFEFPYSNSRLGKNIQNSSHIKRPLVKLPNNAENFEHKRDMQFQSYPYPFFRIQFVDYGKMEGKMGNFSCVKFLVEQERCSNTFDMKV
jgi:hypothetical protein